jgi:GNAT superfamily N-acetyltransferase
MQMALPNHADALQRAGTGRLSRWNAFVRERRRPRQISIAMTYLKPEYQGRGLNLLLYMACQDAALALGCNSALAGPVHEDNAAKLSVLKKTGVDFGIVHRLYERGIG